MSWIIDEFSAKPSGFLAAWRYKRVLIDDNGNITTQDVPGKPSINLSCLTDYNKISRRYANDQLITEFCNFVTFTNYRVYAQNCEPFAYVQTDINATKCGYITPLPEPAVPSNPFGTAVYGAYKYYEFKSVKNVDFKVTIYKKDFVGLPTAITKGDSDPVILSYQTEDEDDKFSPIRALECSISLMCDENFDLQELYTADERAFKVEVLNVDTDEIQFSGFIIPDSCREPFASPPYAVTIRATDGLGALKNITYPIPVGSKINIRQSFKDILCYCFAMTNLNLDLLTICNLYEAKMLTGMDDDPLAQAQVNPLRLSDDQGNIKNCYDVLSDIARLFGAYVAQVNGRWSFVRVNELSNAVIRSRVYSYTGLFKRSQQIANSRTADNTTADVTALTGGELRTANAYKRVIVLTEFGNAATTLYNGDFEIWDGQNFKYWTKYGGINISRVQKTITGTGGAKIGIADYMCQFNEELNEGKWLESTPIVVEKGDKINFQFDFYTDQLRVWNLVKLRFKIGDFYLIGDIDPLDSSSSINLEWVRELTRVELTPNRADQATFKRCSVSIPEIPEAGSLTIQIYGAAKYQTKRVADSPVTMADKLPYSPVSFDNFTISKSSKNEQYEKDGFWSISEQLGFYTNSPKEIKIPYSDSQVPTPGPVTITRFGRTRVINPGGVTEALSLSTLYAIYTTDSSFSTKWRDYNESGESLPISLNLARTILKAYQKPFRYYQGDLRGDNLNYLNVFNFLVDDNDEFSAKTFTIISGDFSLKNHILTATLAEIFTKSIFTTNFQTPHSPGQIPPAITQNPNTPIDDVRIFSDEFTSPFS